MKCGSFWCSFSILFFFYYLLLSLCEEEYISDVVYYAFEIKMKVHKSRRNNGITEKGITDFTEYSINDVKTP